LVHLIKHRYKVLISAVGLFNHKGSSANTTRGRYLSDLLSASHYSFPKTMDTSSSNAIMPATASSETHQAPQYRQPSSHRRYELGSSNASEPGRAEGYPLYNQRQSSADSMNIGNSMRQRMGSEHRPRPTKKNPHASPPRLLLQPQSTYQPPPVTFTIDNRITTALPMATLESLFKRFSRNFQVRLSPKKTLSRDQVYPIDVII
jgi:hypothetical protein